MASGSVVTNCFRQAEEILPSEIWDLTLKKLDEPKDYYSAYNSCFTFKQLLADKRCSYLFPAVFSILMDKNAVTADHPNNLNQKVISLRSVNKHWKSGIDTYLQSGKNYHDNRNIGPEERLHPFLFINRDKVQLFVKKMETCLNNYNPIFTGLVEFDDIFQLTQRGAHQFWKEVTSSFMPKYGKNILYCEIINEFPAENESGFYTVLTKLLGHLQNVQLLQISTQFIENDQLKEIAAQTFFQPFKNLKTLIVDGTAITATNNLIRAATTCELQSLYIILRNNAEATQFNTSCWDLLSQLKSLNTLCLPKFLSYSALISLSSACLLVNKIILTVYLSDDKCMNTVNEEISLSQLFQTLSNVGQTSPLRNLKLKLRGHEKIELGYSLNMPFLEHFSLDCSNGSVAVKSLDFVVPMNALKSLVIIVYAHPFPAKQNHKEIIKFSGLVSNMKRSNIWDVLPTLESLFFYDEYLGKYYNYNKSYLN